MRKPRPVVTQTIYDRGIHVDVDEVDTWVVRAGPQGGTPIVMLHGIPTSAYLYRNVIRGLHEEHDCLAFDWPGYGLSDPARDDDYTHSARAAHLEALLDEFDLDRVHLVVHDMGGPPGLLFAVEHPERVEKLVILNTTVFKRDYRPPLPAVSQFIPGVRNLVRPLLTRPVFDLMMRAAVARPDRLSRETLDHHWALLKSGEGVHAVFESWAQMAEGAPAIRTIREGLGAFPRPTLVMFGAEDRFLPPPNAERFAKTLPDAELQLLPGVGHFLQEDAPEEVADRLHRFLG